MNWFKKLFTKDAPHVFAKLTPSHPHGGLDHFSTSDDWPLSIRIEGVSLEQARRECTGKVLDWGRVSDDQLKAIQKKRLKMTHEELKGMFR